MVMHKIESIERKGKQQYMIVLDCIDHWCRLNNKYYQSYNDIMNMKTRRYNYEHQCSVALTYHIKLTKW